MAIFSKKVSAGRAVCDEPSPRLPFLGATKTLVHTASEGMRVVSLPSPACGTARLGSLSFLAWFLLRLLVDSGGVGLEWLPQGLDEFYVGYSKH